MFAHMGYKYARYVFTACGFKLNRQLVEKGVRDVNEEFFSNIDCFIYYCI